MLVMRTGVQSMKRSAQSPACRTNWRPSAASASWSRRRRISQLVTSGGSVRRSARTRSTSAGSVYSGCCKGRLLPPGIRCPHEETPGYHVAHRLPRYGAERQSPPHPIQCACRRSLRTSDRGRTQISYRWGRPNLESAGQAEWCRRRTPPVEGSPPSACLRARLAFPSIASVRSQRLRASASESLSVQ